MPEMWGYAPGTPSWVDLGSPDLEASRAFYEGLFGWDAEVSPEPEAGGYTMFRKGRHYVAGLGPAMGGQPPVWASYLTVERVEDTVGAVTAAGGAVLMPPMDVMSLGRMAVLLDAGGAAFSVWQPGTFPGAQLVNEPGALCWTELACRDIEQAKAFYRAVFAWEGTTTAYDGSTYTEFRLGGSTIAGMIQMNEQWPPEVPAHWMVYFAVDDTDATAARAEQLGGRVPVPPTEIPPGRFSVLNDPHGAVFSVIRMAVPG